MSLFKEQYPNDSDERKKRRRGRPLGSKGKKKIDDIKMNNRLGIMKDPIDKSYYMQIEFNEVNVWKKLSETISSMKGTLIKFKFTKEQMIISAYDRLKKNIVNFVFDGDKMDKYYCSKEYDFYINPENIHEQLKKLHIGYKVVSMFSLKTDYTSNIHFYFDMKQGILEYIKVSIIRKISPENEIPELSLDEKQYQIAFNLSDTDFKSVIKALDKRKNNIQIEKQNNDKIKITYHYNNKQGSGMFVIMDEEKYEVTSNLEENDIFLVNIHQNNISPLSSFGIVQNYRWYGNSHDSILIVAYTDNKAVTLYYKLSIQNQKEEIDIIGEDIKNDNEIEILTNQEKPSASGSYQKKKIIQRQKKVSFVDDIDFPITEDDEEVLPLLQ